MGVVAAILTVLAGIGALIWRARMMAEAAHSVKDVASDAASALRRFGYKRKANVNPLDAVDDPRLAAAGIMMALARLDGDISREQMAAACDHAARVFSADPQEAADIAQYGRWLAGQGEPEAVAMRLIKGLRGKLTPDERADLFAMAAKIAEVDGPRSPAQSALLAALERALPAKQGA